jgi:hypothetical protein
MSAKMMTRGSRKLAAIAQRRTELVSAYADYIESLDTEDEANWASIINTALDAGLDKEQLCKELSCAWSTVHRWGAGQTAPGAFTRKSIKAQLLTMLDELKAG